MKNDLSQEASTDPYLLLRYRDRQYAADMLAVAIGKLNLFSWLAEVKEADSQQIQSQFSLASRPLDVLLTLCRAMGLLQTDQASGTHQLTSLGQEHLVEHSPFFLGPYYAPIYDSPIAEGCLRVLTTDRPANWQAKNEGNDWHESMMDEAFAQSFTRLMNCRGIVMGQKLANSVSDQISGCRHVLDVGGGSGIYSSTLAIKNPNARFTVLEQAPVDQIARAEIEKHGLSDRIGVLTANMFSDPWPDDVDCILFSNVLHDWDFPEVRKLIAKASDVLPQGGWVVTHEAFINDDKTGPLPVAEYSVLLANITQGKCYSPREYGEIYEENGLEVFPYHDTVADRGYMTARKR